MSRLTTILALALVTSGAGLANSAVAQQVPIQPDWVYRREFRDLQGQSYVDATPRRQRGYFTPLYIPGVDTFNGPSRAYSPIFNAPQPYRYTVQAPNAGTVGYTRADAPRGLFRRRGLFGGLGRRR